MTTRFAFIGFVFLSLFALSCKNEGKPKDFDYGKIENNMYSNSFFNMEMDIPKGWVVQTREQTESLAKQGAEMIAGDDKNLKAALKASEINSANLLAVFQYEVGSDSVDYNANCMLVAENLKNAPGIKTGREYLVQTKKLLQQQTQLEYTYWGGEMFKKVDIGGQEFYEMKASINYMEIPIKQIYYSTVINGFCLTAIISYMTDEQKAELEKTVGSMKFK